MARSRTSSVIFLVVLAAAAACQKHGKYGIDEACRDEGTTSVLVGPAANQVNPTCVILHKDDTVYFMATNATTALLIDFPNPQPFLNMKKLPNGRWTITCKGSTCWSDHINPAAPSGIYDYNQTLTAADPDAPPDKADGRIIIVRP